MNFTPSAFLLNLKRSGILVSLDNNELVIKGDRKALTPDIAAIPCAPTSRPSSISA